MFKRENFKKKSLLRKVTALGLTLTLLPGVLTGCSTKSEASDVKKIVIGSGNSYNPYCYIDENGNAVGYEYDVLAAIDELLPQYEFEYKSMAFDQILLSLDSGKIDVAAHQYEYTDERASKYLFSDESYTSYITYISVLSDDNEINGLEDLAGQRVRAGGATSATTQILKKWNADHPGKEIIIVNSDSSTDEEVVAALKNGADRATVSKKSDIAKLNSNYSDDGNDWIKAVGEPVNNSQTYYLYKQGNDELKEAIDGALKTLKENGTLSELAIKWVGYDVTESE
ncbi:transporter substrate-binding domain-containing protein [Lachnospira multipara]|uniref:transporter substrate-binding domain-containing protein n=1 Tax=Lachnospira multipara TaxID=28051 RepID=UPI0003FFEF74|nr:transporter substrate-binding domain-containing protein [Lachnospira multipara]